MNRRFAIRALVAGVLLLALAYGAQLVLGRTPRWMVWTYLLGMSTTMLGMLVLGVARRHAGVGRLALPFLFIYAVLLAGFGLALGLDGETATDPLWLGLPRRAAIVIYGIGVLPLFLLPIAYALTFETMTLREEDMERVAAARRAREALVGMNREVP